MTKYYKKIMAMLMVLFTSFQCVLPAFANETETMATSNIHVTVEGNGILEIKESENTVQVTNENPYDATLNVGTNVHFSIAEGENLTIEDFALNNATVENFIANSKSFTYDYSTTESDANFTIRFKELEPPVVETGKESENLNEENSQEQSEQSVQNTEEKDETPSKKENLVKLDRGDLVMDKNNVNESLTISTSDQAIIDDYKNGNKNKPEYVELRKELVEKIHAQKYVDEDYFITDSYFDDYNTLSTLIYMNAAILIDPDYSYEMGINPNVQNSSKKISLFSMSNPTVTYFWQGSIVTISNQWGTLSMDAGQWAVDGMRAYCGNANYAPPQLGHRMKAAQDVSSNERLRKAMYYGLQNPGDRVLSACGGNIDKAALVTNELVSYAYSGQTVNGNKVVVNQFSWIYDLPSPPSNFKIYAAASNNYGTNWAGQYTLCQALVFWKYEDQGTLQLKKSSANPSITDNNPCYSLESAEYGLYNSQADANADKNRVETFTIKADGYSNVSKKLAYKTYYLKETKAPKGYALDPNVTTVTINNTVTQIKEMKDLPQSDPVSILLGKIDKETNANKPQGSASLENAQFTVKYYKGLFDTDPAEQGEKAERTWVLKTDEDGYTDLSTEYKVSGDEFYYESNGDVVIPIGTITIQETLAPVGYQINNEVFVRQITSVGNMEWVDTYNQPTIPEQVIRFTVKKVQEGTNVSIPDTKFVHTKPNGQQETVATNGNGQFELIGLETGIHSIQETEVMDGYDINSTKVEFEVKSGGQIVMLTDLTGTGITFGTDSDNNGVLKVSDKVTDFTLQIKKVNDHNKLLKGAEFTLYSDKECTKEIDTLVSDENGILQFKSLKDRTKYYFKETKAPDGYRIPVDEHGNVHVYELMVESTPATDTFDFYVDGVKYTKADFAINQPVHWEGSKADRIVNVTVTNKVGIQLPNTGSFWTGLLFFMGVACMTVAILHKRIMKEE